MVRPEVFVTHGSDHWETFFVIAANKYVCFFLLYFFVLIVVQNIVYVSWKQCYQYLKQGTCIQQEVASKASGGYRSQICYKY